MGVGVRHALFPCGRHLALSSFLIWLPASRRCSPRQAESSASQQGRECGSPRSVLSEASCPVLDVCGALEPDRISANPWEGLSAGMLWEKVGLRFWRSVCLPLRVSPLNSQVTFFPSPGDHLLGASWSWRIRALTGSWPSPRSIHPFRISVLKPGPFGGRYINEFRDGVGLPDRCPRSGSQ